MKTATTHCLPDELMLRIVAEAEPNPKDLVAWTRVNRQFYRVTQDDRLWQGFAPAMDVIHCEQKNPGSASGERLGGYASAFKARMARKPASVQRMMAQMYSASPRGRLTQTLMSGGSKPLGLLLQFDLVSKQRREAFLRKNIAKIFSDFDALQAYLAAMQAHPSERPDAWTHVMRAVRPQTNRLFDEPVIAQALVRQYPPALVYLSAILRDNETIIREAISVDGAVLRYASRRLRHNERLEEMAVCSSLGGYASCDPWVRAKPKLLALALKTPYVPQNQPWYACLRPLSPLAYAPTALVNKTTALLAVKQLSTAYARALPLWLQLDPEVFLAASAHKDFTFDGVPDHLLENKALLMQVMVQHPTKAFRLGPSLVDSKDMPFLLTYASLHPEYALHLLWRYHFLRESEPFMRVVLGRGLGSAIRFAAPRLRARRSLQHLALSHGAVVRDFGVYNLFKSTWPRALPPGEQDKPKSA